MDDIIILDNEVDVCMTMTWYPEQPHGQCGHLYELIEYYLVLSRHYNIKILFGDSITCWSDFENVIISKYQLSTDELNSFRDNTIYKTNPKYIKCRNIFFVDGSLIRLDILGVVIMANIITFKCAVSETIHDRLYKNIKLLQDERVYINHTPEDVALGIHYVKKVFCDKFKALEQSSDNVGLLYLTSNCRDIEMSMLEEIITTYDFNRYVILTNNTDKFKNIHRCTTLQPPVKDIFSMFSDYIYTPLKGVWDGSPRFPIECKYYNKNVHYHKITSEYLDQDSGLRIRMNDIESDWESICLNYDDDIITIFEDILQ